MQGKLFLYPIVFAIAFVAILGDYYLKKSSGEERFYLTLMFFIGWLLYGLTAFGWAYVMRYQSLTWIGVAYSSTTMLGLMFLGYFFFNEPITIKKVLAVCFAILAIGLSDS